MDTDRWQQIERLDHSAMEREPGERESYLTSCCGSDDTLRREVDVLLTLADRTDGSRKAATSSTGPQAGPSASSALRPAREPSSTTRRLGRYEILEQVGKGGMGVVYRAVDPAIGRTVAIKTIPLGGLDDAQNSALRTRLLRESQAGGQLSHPNIVAVYDVSEQGDIAYIVMEYVVGRTLEQAAALDQSVRSLPEVLRIVHDCAGALDYAHSHGVVHRDIKPANIMLQAEGTVKIADFGIAKSAQLSALTQSSVVLGSPHYMAPEQWKGEVVTGRTDQFALATVAFALLTGRRPFEGDTTATQAAKVLYEEPPAVTSLNPALPVALDEVFLRALAKSPAARYQTCLQFANVLREAAVGAPTAPHASASASASASAPALMAAPARRFNWILPVLILALLIVAGVGFWLYQRNGAEQVEITYWTSIKDSKTAAPFQEYLQRYPDGQFADLARAQLSTVNNRQPQSTAPETARETTRPVKTAETKSPTSVAPPKTLDKAPQLPPERPPVALPTPKQPPPPAVDPFVQAENLVKIGDFEGALPYFSKAIAVHPDYRSYFGRAGVYQHMGRLDQAIEDYTQGIRQNPDIGMAYHERAICLARANREDRALVDFNKAIELTPNLAIAWNGRGAIFLHRALYRRAISDFDQAIRINPGLFMAYKNRADAKRALGDVAGANTDLNQARRLQP
jgi:tetratricopeptide (TPR) repeat protein